MIRVVLLKALKSLGKPSQVVNVKRGYAANFLIPNGYAVVANKQNLAMAEEKKSQILNQDEQHRSQAKKVLDLISGKKIVVIRQSSDDGNLYGSVLPKDILSSLEADTIGLSGQLSKDSIKVNGSIRSVGSYSCVVTIYDDIECKIGILVGRTKEEAMSFAIEKVAKTEVVEEPQEFKPQQIGPKI